MATEAALELDLKPIDRSVQQVRLMVHAFAMLATDDRGLAGRVTVTCAELVDVVARKRCLSCGVRVSVDARTGRARIQVTFDAAEETIRAVEQNVAMASRGAPADAYTQALMVTTRESDNVLGLARVRYEGRMTLGLQRVPQGRCMLFAECANAYEEQAA